MKFAAYLPLTQVSEEPPPLCPGAEEVQAACDQFAQASEAVLIPDENLERSCQDAFFYYHRQDLGPAHSLAAKVKMTRQWWASWLDLYASVRMCMSLMMVPETFMVLFSAITSVFLFDWEFQHLSVNLTWSTIGFLLAFPLQNAICSAYSRRETAVDILASFRALLMNVMLANALWDWPGTACYDGRREPAERKKTGQRVLDTVRHAQRVHSIISKVVDALHQFLLVPRGGCPRHEYCQDGQKEARAIGDSEAMGRKVILSLLQRLQGATEDLKSAGLPANEASRINQYNMQLVAAFERLWSIKTYRTPIGLRAIVRVFIQVLPYFYGPYWVHIARNEDGDVTPGRLAMSCTFSCATSLLLIAMMNLANQMENPFEALSLDAVRVDREIRLIRECVDDASTGLHEDWYKVESPFEWEVQGWQGIARE